MQRLRDQTEQKSGKLTKLLNSTRKMQLSDKQNLFLSFLNSWLYFLMDFQCAAAALK